MMLGLRQSKGVIYLEDHKTTPPTRITMTRVQSLSLEDALDCVNRACEDIAVEIDDHGRQHRPALVRAE